MLIQTNSWWRWESEIPDSFALAVYRIYTGYGVKSDVSIINRYKNMSYTWIMELLLLNGIPQMSTELIWFKYNLTGYIFKRV
jgi:hypothetical protein